MAMVFPYVVRCRCGESIVANLADGVNVARTPEIRDEILSGRLHRVSCPACGITVTAEKSFLYTDLTQGTVIQVKPRHDRHLYKETSRNLSEAAKSIPEDLLPQSGIRLRVVFGMAELREKLVAEDLHLDDRAVELLKVLLLNEHPFLLERPRFRLALAGATEETIDFVAAYDFDPAHYRVSLPRGSAEEIARDEGRLRSWTAEAGHREPLFGLSDDHWVNLWRWSPQPSALDQLRHFAGDIRAGRPINMASEDFRRMLRGLPRGTHLPTWAKQDLQLLFTEARRTNDELLQDALFEIRFAKSLEDDWARNSDPNDIDTLWNLLRALPETDVAGNASIADLNLDEGRGGGSYEPSTGDIYIGSRMLSDREGFEDVVRHEIGHGVHEARSAEVNRWLADTFGWRMFSPTQDGLDDWVDAMGGWASFGATDQDRRDILGYIRTALGVRSSWDPGPTPNVSPGHTWWNRDFGPRLAYERTGSDWYMNYPRWYRINGNAFFLNYWYKTLCVVSEDALSLVARMPSPYAAMSTYEFFAELYALYHDLDDPLRRVIPADVLNWFDNNLGPSRSPMRAPAAPEKEAWETVTRPG